MKNIALFILFVAVLAGDLGAQGINFNTLPAISSITATSPFPTVTSGGRWRKATAAQMQAFIMPRPVTRVAPTNRYLLGYVSGSDSLQYIPGGIMSQLPIGNVTIAADTSQWTITSLAGINFVNAAAGSGWVNRVQTSRSTTNFLTFKSGQTVTIGTDTTAGAALRWNTTGIYAKADSMFITPENLDSINVGEVLTVVGKISNRAWIETRSASGLGISDGDKGDITVSSSGSVWSLDNGVVGSPQLASSGVTASTYALGTFTVDQDGRITSATNGVLAASAVLDFPSTTAGGTQDLTITVTGAVDGDPVAIGVPNACATTGTFFGWVSASNTVTIRFFNNSGGSVNPTSGTFKVKVIP
jgi:hypothetical protein